MKILSESDLSELFYLAKSDENKYNDENYVYHVEVSTAYILDEDIHTNRLAFGFMNFEDYSRFLGFVLLHASPKSIVHVGVTNGDNPRLLTPFKLDDSIL
jgi:hypothetical protein